MWNALLCYPVCVKTVSVLFVCVALLGVSACETKAVLPTGVQTIHAVVQSVPFSLKRRGTHGLLDSQGTMFAFAESTAVNLRALEGREVDLEGIYEQNTDDEALPVVVVQKVINGGEEELRSWKIPALGLTVHLPRSWKGVVQGKTAAFTATGSAAPVLTITTVAGAQTSSAGSQYGALPSPSIDAFVVGLRKATAEMNADGDRWVVRVVSADSRTDFAFSLTEGSAEQQVASFRRFLKTVTFDSGASASKATSSRASSMPAPSSVSGSTGSSGTSRASGEGSPCGGVAGILCPKGFYCKIADSTTETGTCVKR